MKAGCVAQLVVHLTEDRDTSSIPGSLLTSMEIDHEIFSMVIFFSFKKGTCQLLAKVWATTLEV